jgi:hypothetical protein
MIKRWSFVVTMLIATACAKVALADSWHQAPWHGWEFDFGVYGTQGLELRNVSRNGKSVIARAGLAAMRVDYEPGRCHDSPFADLIVWDQLLPFEWWRQNWGRSVWSVDHNWCGEKVCGRYYSIDGVEWLEIGVLGTEGNYLIYQAWYLSSDGRIMARVFSKGVQCNNATHRHHPYWRFDFDVGQSDHNAIYEYNNSYGDESLTPYLVERDAVKDARSNRMWFVQDNLTKDGVWVIPGHVNGRDDGDSDSFSTRDVSARLYHPDEVNGPWANHHQGYLELEYNNLEPIEDANVVLWYTAHFQHDEPQPTFDPNAPCGDPQFPPVFDPRPHENCNDVFGAGPTLLVVNSPGDHGPFDGGQPAVRRPPPATGCDVVGRFGRAPNK